MSSRKDSLWRWWSQFEQVQQLSDIMSQSLKMLIDDYLSSASDQRRGAEQTLTGALGFDQYIMHRAITEVRHPQGTCWTFERDLLTHARPGARPPAALPPGVL